MIKYYDIDQIYPKSILKIKLSPRYYGKTKTLSKNRRIERKFKND